MKNIVFVTQFDDSLNLNKTKKLIHYIISEKYSGYDPYDGLKSPIFNLNILKSNKKFRFLFQQFIKRFPFNLRPLLGIKKGTNPVTLGLCIQAFSYLSEVDLERKKFYLEQIDEILEKLLQLQNKNYSGICWGYNFDWEARYFSIKAYEPTVVATGIISNALFESWKITKNEKLKEIIISCSNFVLKDLNRTYSGENFCFSYSPFDQQKVLNASMKASRILAQTYFFTKEEYLLNEIEASVNFVLNCQQKNGSFTYSDKRAKIDNYHTAYILDCLDEIQKCTNWNTFDDNLKLGFGFYLNNFIEKNGATKFYNDATFPIDCTAGGQTLLTLSRFNLIDRANDVANYFQQNMQTKSGTFYYRKFKLFTNKTSFMRWSNAWMLVGLSYLWFKKTKA